MDFGFWFDLCRLSLQNAIAAAVQPLNFEKHIDFTKLVSWKHVTFEIPLSRNCYKVFTLCDENHRNMVSVTQTIVPSPSM